MPASSSVCWRVAPGRRDGGGRVLRARVGQLLLSVERTPASPTSYFMIWQVHRDGGLMPVASGQRGSVHAAMSASEEAAYRIAGTEPQDSLFQAID